MGKVVLVTGGVRSGKSGFVQRRLAKVSPATLIATGRAVDEEMALRIKRHKQDRPDRVTTLEADAGIAESVRGLQGIVAVDCLGTWVTNRMWDLGLDFDAPDAQQAARVAETIEAEAQGILDAAAASSAEVWLVTNEVGWGMIPANPVGRLFADTLGRVNQLMARGADEVFLVCCSIPVKIK